MLDIRISITRASFMYVLFYEFILHISFINTLFDKNFIPVFYSNVNSLAFTPSIESSSSNTLI